MDDFTRAEYPAILPNLQPGQAVQTLNDRVKRINRNNIEIADWLQERRRVEEQYVLGLRKLSQFKVPASHAELGVFQTPWARILGAIDRIAQSHHRLAESIERDVELPLRAAQQRPDMQNIYTISNNLSNIAKELEDAQGKSDKLSKKGNKANSQKVDMASSKLESAQQQWDSQAPFVFESLQALDESRVNQLRDLLTQYQTHETDLAERLQIVSAETLAVMLDISTEAEVQNFVSSVLADRPVPITRSSTRRSSVTTPQPSNPPPLPLGATDLSTRSETPSTPAKEDPPAPIAADSTIDGLPPSQDAKPESKLRRFGTLFAGRRRQSVHGGFGQLSPPKASAGFGRLSAGGRGVSPRASASNLQDTGRLSSLAESPDVPSPQRPKTSNDRVSKEALNGLKSKFNQSETPPALPVPATVNGSHDISNVAPPPGPPPVHKDEEGFTVRSPMNDPISEAEKEAAGDEVDQIFKLSIQNQPVAEEDPLEKQAALSNVSNSLKLAPAIQRAGTTRGRRDVRNTIYKPAPIMPDLNPDTSLVSIPGSSSFASSLGRAPSAAALVSEASIAGVSDNQSVRSGTSLGNFAVAHHPEMTGPGLNSSIIETVSAHFDDGVVKSVSVSGEIAFINNVTDPDSTKTHETIKINNFPRLEKIGPNRIFVQNSTPDQSDQFSLDLSHLTKTATAFSYRVFAEETDPPSLATHAPLLIKPAWKPHGDKLGLLLQYQLNPSCRLAGPVTLHNVVFVATYDGKANGAQTKPSGTHLKDKHLVYWRLGEVTLTNEAQKIVCRIIGADGTEPRPGQIEARWDYSVSGNASGQGVLASGISVSRLDVKGKGKETEDDPFSDIGSGQTWIDVPLESKLVSGKYEGR